MHSLTKKGCHQYVAVLYVHMYLFTEPITHTYIRTYVGLPTTEGLHADPLEIKEHVGIPKVG